ncbi:MAG TPA: peptidase M48, partial [Candidatus Sulfotelmatobacter sp.]|nr:peptidase M48 [Candidatus Sulfotelmatobacter sp.]
KSQQEIGTILPSRDQYMVDTLDFQQVKKRLALIMKHRLQKDGKDSKENPELRRTAGDKNPDPNNDDRPVIKRNPGK